jgi:hypothetical protein
VIQIDGKLEYWEIGKGSFTAEAQAGTAATKTRNISRKDAKAAKVGKNGQKNS